MLTVRVINNRGQALTITGKEDRYQLINVDGLQPPSVSVNSTPVAAADGSIFNSARIGTRNIVLQIRINGDVESNRLDLYKYFAVKEKIELRFVTKSREVKISGYVENVECPLFTNSEIMQISIICLNPYFQDVNSTTALISISPGAPTQNSSDVPMGLQFDIYANSGQFHSITITNETTGEFLKLARQDGTGYFLSGSRVRINTANLEKSVLYNPDGIGNDYFNDFQSVVIGSTFFQIAPFAANQITYEIDDDPANSAEVKVTYAKSYRGI